MTTQAQKTREDLVQEIFRSVELAKQLADWAPFYAPELKTMAKELQEMGGRISRMEVA